jgi:hypothetical protein
MCLDLDLDQGRDRESGSGSESAAGSRSGSGSGPGSGSAWVWIWIRILRVSGETYSKYAAWGAGEGRNLMDERKKNEGNEARSGGISCYKYFSNSSPQEDKDRSPHSL